MPRRAAVHASLHSQQFTPSPLTGLSRNVIILFDLYDIGTPAGKLQDIGARAINSQRKKKECFESSCQTY